MERVTVICFLASYAVALGLEVWHQLRPRPIVRLVGLGFGAAGLFAQTVYLDVQRPPLVWQAGWMLFLSWVLAIFYLAGSVHHRRQAWGLFVLPLMLALIVLASAFGPPPAGSAGVLAVPDFWGRTHALLLFLAAIGVCVGFLASLMYLLQARRLRTKALPGKGLRLLSLERLEAMNRRAINLAFPLLTAGVVIGATLLLQGRELPGWSDLRVLSTLVLWVAFAVLVFLRYGYHLRGRSVAVLTIAVFFLLLGCLALSHPVGQGGGR
jgi:ABC-type uncharacterized transport system permease subunit